VDLLDNLHAKIHACYIGVHTMDRVDVVRVYDFRRIRWDFWRITSREGADRALQCERNITGEVVVIVMMGIFL